MITDNFCRTCYQRIDVEKRVRQLEDEEKEWKILCKRYKEVLDDAGITIKFTNNGVRWWKEKKE